jgi:transglutaminase-like putative cysteine protease
MQLHIRHETAYRYARPIGATVQVIRLTPRAEPGQRTIRWTLVTPGRRVQHLDAFGNLTHLVTLDEPRDEILILAQGVVESADNDGMQPADENGLSPLAFLSGTRLTRVTPEIRSLAAGAAVRHPGRAGVLDLAHRIRQAVDYVPGATEVHHDAAEALRLGKGVCQDHTHLFIAACHSHGIPARYVSGYVHTGDANMASHAWADVWLEEERGWFSLDITNAQPANNRYCRLAVGRDYLDACPVRGVRRGGGDEAMSVRVYVGASADQ